MRSPSPTCAKMPPPSSPSSNDPRKISLVPATTVRTRWVLDNTKANWRAMLKMQEEYPKLIMRGCFAHGLSLCMKDFRKHRTAFGPNAWDRCYGLKWAEQVVKDSNTVANYLQDSGMARKIVRSSSALHLHVVCIGIDVPHSGRRRWELVHSNPQPLVHSIP